MSICPACDPMYVWGQTEAPSTRMRFALQTMRGVTSKMEKLRAKVRIGFPKSLVEKHLRFAYCALKYSDGCGISILTRSFSLHTLLLILKAIFCGVSCESSCTDRHLKHAASVAATGSHYSRSSAQRLSAYDTISSQKDKVYRAKLASVDAA